MKEPTIYGGGETYHFRVNYEDQPEGGSYLEIRTSGPEIIFRIKERGRYVAEQTLKINELFFVLPKILELLK